jgi:hypothetical protein
MSQCVTEQPSPVQQHMMQHPLLILHSQC